SQTIEEIEQVLDSRNEIDAYGRVLGLTSKYWPELLKGDELRVISDEITFELLSNAVSTIQQALSKSPTFNAILDKYVQLMEKKLKGLNEETMHFLSVVFPKLERIVDGIE
ncbi:hypothetical protein PFISCL1PPCAC_1424, partial [Pristionchus fissidentatus]